MPVDLIPVVVDARGWDARLFLFFSSFLKYLAKKGNKLFFFYLIEDGKLS